MSDPSSMSDDPFSDLYGKLPDPKTRDARVGASEPLGDGAQPSVEPTTAVPLSRRAARAAATNPSTVIPPAAAAAAPQQPVPARPAQPDPAASAPATAPMDVSPFSVADGAGATATARVQTVRAATGTAAASTPATLDALFSDEAHADHAVAPVKKRRRRRTGCLVALVILALIFGGIAAAGFWVWNTYEDNIRSVMGWEEPKDYEDGLATGEVVVTIQPGDTGAAISETLYDAGVTKTSDAFYDYLVTAGENPTFQPGAYRLQSKMTSAAALEALMNPANKLENTAQLREGLTVEQSLPILAEATGLPVADYEAAVADPAAYGVAAGDLEGWLFPATYTFDPGVTAPQVVQRLVDRTIESLDAAGVPAEQRQDVLTRASIIQREARINEDFYKVSRVIQNRLDIGMQLQMDSTSQYGYGELHDGTVSTSGEAQYDDNPWNTYVIPGLPVGPIANPGDVAIDAAMHPADGPWLFFVTWNLDTGETIFSSTDAEHEQAKEQWAQWCEENPDGGC